MDGCEALCILCVAAGSQHDLYFTSYCCKVIKIDDESKVDYFQEKNQTDSGWINGGFFVFNREIFNYLVDDQTVLEDTPLRKMTSEGELMAFKHSDFWQCMDTLRDREFLEELWNSGEAPWK